MLCLVVLPLARLPSWMCPVVVGDTCKFENVIRARMLLPPPHPMTTTFGSIGAESNEWARGLCPAGLLSAGGKSGVNVTAASTVRDTASLLLIPSIPSCPRAQRYTVKHWALRASVGMAGVGTGVAEAGADVVVDKVVPLRRRVSVQWPG